jgi:hypothetical protein
MLMFKIFVPPIKPKEKFLVNNNIKIYLGNKEEWFEQEF